MAPVRGSKTPDDTASSSAGAATDLSTFHYGGDIIDRKINNYKSSHPITLYRWDLECLMDVIDLALKDERDYPNRSSSGYLALKRLGDRLHPKRPRQRPGRAA